MDHAGLVRGVEHPGHVGEPTEPLLERDVSGTPILGPQVLPVDVFHREIQELWRLAHVEDRDDVRVIQRRDRARLADEAALVAFAVVAVALRDHLERDPPLEARVGGAVHDAHATAPEERLHEVGSDGRGLPGAESGAMAPGGALPRGVTLDVRRGGRGRLRGIHEAKQAERRKGCAGDGDDSHGSTAVETNLVETPLASGSFP